MTENAQNIWKHSSMVRSLSGVYIGHMISQVANLGTALIMIRGLTVPDYASFVAYNSIAYLFSGLVGSGINTALVRFSSEHLSRTGKRLYSLYAIALVAESSIYFFILIVSFTFPKFGSSLLLANAEFAQPFRLGALSGLGLLLLQLGQSIYQAEERFALFVGTIWLSRGLAFAGVIVLWLFHALSFETVAWLMAVLNVAVGVGLIFRVVGGQFTELLPFLKQSKELVHQFLSATGWLIGYFGALTAFSQMDVLMLSRFATEKELAVYGVAYRYYSMALLLLTAIHTVLLPKFSRVEMRDSQVQQQFLLRWFRYSLWIAMPIAIFDIVGKPLFIAINGGVYEKSFIILVVLSLGIWLSLMFSPLVNILISRNDFRFLFLLGGIALVICFVANYLLVPLMGGVGAAISEVVSIGFINLTATVRARYTYVS